MNVKINSPRLGVGFNNPIIREGGGEPYSGAYEVTPSEQTQTLETENKKLTQNVTVKPIPAEYIVPTGTLGITGNGVFDVSAYASANVSVGTVTMKEIAIRPDAEIVKSYSYDKKAVDDLGVTLPSYSTNNVVLKAAADLSETVSLDFANYTYLIAERMIAIPVYSTSSVAKGRQEYQFVSNIYEIEEIPANQLSALINTTKVGTRSYSINTNNFSRLVYWNSATSLVTNSTANGAYLTPTAPTISGTTLTIKSPSLSLRGSTTYLTSTFFNVITDIRMQYILEVYKAPKRRLDFDGWETYQNVNRVLGCINSNTHKLT